METLLLNEREAARMLGMSQSWLQQQRRKGGDVPPHVLVGNRIRYRLDDLRKWTEHAHTTAPEVG